MTESYTIQRGESLSTIAAKYGVDWQQLALANDIPVTKKNGKPFALIQPGQMITIPPSGSETKSGKVEVPAKTPPPPPPKPKPTAMAVQLQSEYDKNPMSGTVVVPDPPPPPPPPTIKADQPPVVPGDEGLNFQEDQTPWWQKIHEAIDPVRVMGNTNSPGLSDYLQTAAAGMGPGSVVESLMGRNVPRIAQPMAGTARDIGDNTVTNLPPRSLLDSKFLKVPGRAEPPFGRGPKPPVVIGQGGRFVKGTWMPGQNPNLRPPLGERPEPPFNAEPSLADILSQALSQ